MLIEDNIFHNNIPVGGENIEVLSFNNSATLVTRNLFYENGGIGCIGIRSVGTNCRIINNTFDRNERGFFSISYGTVAINNIVSNSSAYGINAANSTDFATLDYNNVWNCNEGYGYAASPGANSLSVDPEYVDEANFNYYLQAISPCIDAGDPDPIYEDLDGTPSDIGAYPLAIDEPYAINMLIESNSTLNVVDHLPTFMWGYYDSSGSQIALQFEVGSDNDWTTAEMWSSGTVNTADTTLEYSGLPLNDGEFYYARIRLANSMTWGSWVYFLFRMNSLPTTPVGLNPINSEVVHYLNVSLETETATDPESDHLFYDFEVYDDELLTNKVAEYLMVEDQWATTKTPLFTTLDPDVDYWWQVRSFDGHEYSGWSDAETFRTRNHLTVTVPTDFASIQAAINAVSDFDVIEVEPGVYYGNIDFKEKSIKLISTSGAENTIIEPSINTMTTIDMDNTVYEYTELAWIYCS